MDYNFLVAPEDPLPTIGVSVDPPTLLKDFTPKMFLKDVGKAYKEIGGLQWLIGQAQAQPAEFMKLLQKMMPKTVDLDLMEGTKITLVDTFSGQSVEIAGPAGPGEPDGPAGETATGGTPEIGADASP